MLQPDASDIMALIEQAPWREAVTYRDTLPHEYVFVKKDGQEDLLAAFSARHSWWRGAEKRSLTTFCQVGYSEEKIERIGELGLDLSDWWACRS